MEVVEIVTAHQRLLQKKSDQTNGLDATAQDIDRVHFEERPPFLTAAVFKPIEDPRCCVTKSFNLKFK